MVLVLRERKKRSQRWLFFISSSFQRLEVALSCLSFFTSPFSSPSLNVVAVVVLVVDDGVADANADSSAHGGARDAAAGAAAPASDKIICFFFGGGRGRTSSSE